MTPLAQGTLPLATTAAFTPRCVAPPRDAGDWAQALARATAGAGAGAVAASPARASGTFGHAAAASPALPQAASAPAGASPDATVAPAHSRLASQQLAMAHAPAFVDATAVPATGADPARGFAPASPQPTASSEPEATASAAPEAAESSDQFPAPVRPRTPASGPAGPRVHVEWRDDGLAVWLGLDAGPQAASAQAAGVLDALRRRPGLLPRLASLVCNGIPIPTHPVPSKETP